MKKINLILLFSLLCAVSLQAQPAFVSQGKIEFERKTNMHRLYYNDDDSWSMLMKKTVPQFKTEYFDLVFAQDKSLYKPGKETETINTGFFRSPASDNIVFKDFLQQLRISQKDAYDNKFVLTDSIRYTKWRLEPETRTIAGFECHKAITTICDSVVVVAFYTDQIISASGPESFSGLPGMILGLAVPRLYTTWFATKLETISATEEKQIQPPTKGKAATNKELLATIAGATKNWRGERAMIQWFVTL